MWSGFSGYPGTRRQEKTFSEVWDCAVPAGKAPNIFGKKIVVLDVVWFVEWSQTDACILPSFKDVFCIANLQFYVVPMKF